MSFRDLQFGCRDSKRERARSGTDGECQVGTGARVANEGQFRRGAKSVARESVIFRASQSEFCSSGESELALILGNLSQAELTLLLKYIYYGLARPNQFNCSALLNWHEKVVELTGVAGICKLNKQTRYFDIDRGQLFALQPPPSPRSDLFSDLISISISIHIFVGAVIVVASARFLIALIARPAATFALVPTLSSGPGPSLTSAPSTLHRLPLAHAPPELAQLRLKRPAKLAQLELR
ncbi:Actin-related protein 2/3 complex subunit 5 [Smittium culicis]|uniref:Actin-related protein 2/3 complex subunit 5 n=1 Tax=Smittium culicis TaxID=133412 RepID=A0A1R1YL70_9FUNG|nr:Actin-related protein 2/3 complex subunit 5 [Smittium culicis]